LIDEIPISDFLPIMKKRKVPFLKIGENSFVDDLERLDELLEGEYKRKMT
jgi:hypothetical protein